MDDLRAVMQESWSRAVVAVGSVEQHAEALVERLGQKVGTISPDQARRLAGEVAQKLTAQRAELTGQLQAAVAKGIDKARVPTRAALRELADKLSALEQRLAKVESNQEKP